MRRKILRVLVAILAFLSFGFALFWFSIWVQFNQVLTAVDPNQMQPLAQNYGLTATFFLLLTIGLIVLLTRFLRPQE